MLCTRKFTPGRTSVCPCVLHVVQASYASLSSARSFESQVRACSNFGYVSGSVGSHCLAKSIVQDCILRLPKKSTFGFGLFSTMAGTILVQARDPAKLNVEIQNAVDENRLNDAWKFYEQYMEMDGFPRKSVVNKLLAGFVESCDVEWLEKAYGLVEQAIGESKQNLLERNMLVFVSFGLARAGLPVPASTVLRRMVEMEEYPPVAAWSAVLAYMSQTAQGAYVAAELILEIGYLFQDHRVDPRKKCNAPLIAMKPNTTAFNIALAGCLLFGTTKKAEQLLDMMPRVGIKMDANLLVLMAQIYERNGRRDELRKLQRYVDEAHNLTDVQFRQFYNCLLACHLKFGDLDSASNMILEMLRKAKKARGSLAVATLVFDAAGRGNKFRRGAISESWHHSSHRESYAYGDNRLPGILVLSYEEFSIDRNFLRLEAEAKEVLGALLAKLQSQVELVTTDRGILQPTEKIFAKLVKAFLEADKTKDLAAFLIKADREDSPASNDDSALVNVINSCISLGWLDKAHDLLDEMCLAGVKTGSSVYAALLKAYCEANQAGNAASLLRDARKAGIQLDASSYEALIRSKVLQNDTQGALHLYTEMKEAKIPKAGHQEFERLVKECAEGCEPRLMVKLLEEVKEGQATLDSAVHDWNNVIHFFCRKRLMQDAEKALKKMRSLGHAPNAQTFHSMVTGYAAVGGKYIEVTELWGEMKSLAYNTSMKFDQELLDSVLYTFVRGGFFSRANEVLEMMEKAKMFIDKYKYRTLFLKYHKTLHKGKAPKFQTESQLKKREAALAFKNWIGVC
ncbi:PREDICTED: pentatricopeptide repeat-containing protein At1g03100, mitochondrial [Fragaria vesca subsp. vesca]|uniref:pentatricopeptide repeat-containing protein At1g03100, mitochondrial n=1 Tax=Fragaria vesca subsp. vesca TaxID=101020 RepID=UPI0002C370E2|nr:PREDICTED: pentatricopeptide repeat-containing protein At1g03100, mitochondrial [Fragaria vesca subsp. vesca]